MSNKVRILQVIDRIGNAGAETLQRTFAQQIDRSRFDLHVCGLRPRPGSVTLGALQEMGVPTVVLNQHTSYDLPALSALVSYIRKARIDLIHTHLQAADIMGRMAGLLTRRPVVSTIHNGRIDLDSEPRHRQQLERWTAHLWCRKLVVVSELLREEVANWFGLPLDRVVTIPNGVDTDQFRPLPEAEQAEVKQQLLGGQYPMVVSVARLEPQKDPRSLVEAASIVLQRRPEVRFVMIGEGSMREGIEAFVSELGLAGKVLLPGFRANVSGIVASSQAFVLSSLWEGLPVALLEAMAAGCPTVATDVGGVAQVVQQGTTGLLVPPRDIPALAQALLTYLGNPDYARRIGERARAQVVSDFGARAWARKLEDLYQSELGLPIVRPEPAGLGV